MGYEPIPWTIADNEGWKSAWMIPAIKAGKNWDQCQKLESVDRKKEKRRKKNYYAQGYDTMNIENDLWIILEFLLDIFTIYL